MSYLIEIPRQDTQQTESRAKRIQAKQVTQEASGELTLRLITKQSRAETRVEMTGQDQDQRGISPLFPQKPTQRMDV